MTFYQHSTSQTEGSSMADTAFTMTATRTAIDILQQNPELLLSALRKAKSWPDAVVLTAAIWHEHKQRTPLPSSAPSGSLSGHVLTHTDLVTLVRAIAHAEGIELSLTPTDADGALCVCGEETCSGCSCGFACPFSPGHDYEEYQQKHFETIEERCVDILVALVCDLALAYAQQPARFQSLLSVRRARALYDALAKHVQRTRPTMKGEQSMPKGGTPSR